MIREMDSGICHSEQYSHEHIRDIGAFIFYGESKGRLIKPWVQDVANRTSHAMKVMIWVGWSAERFRHLKGERVPEVDAYMHSGKLLKQYCDSHCYAREGHVW